MRRSKGRRKRDAGRAGHIVSYVGDAAHRAALAVLAGQPLPGGGDDYWLEQWFDEVSGDSTVLCGECRRESDLGRNWSIEKDRVLDGTCVACGFTLIGEPGLAVE